MRVIVGGRAAGKSTEVVRWVAQSPTKRVALVASMPGVDYLVARARELYPNLDVDWSRNFRVATIGGLRGCGDVEVFVDEIQHVLANLLGAAVVGVTGSNIETYDIGQRSK